MSKDGISITNHQLIHFCFCMPDTVISFCHLNEVKSIFNESKRLESKQRGPPAENLISKVYKKLRSFFL